MKVFLVFPVLLILIFGTPVFADFEKGAAAALRGDYATALEQWKPFAEQGDASAQFNLGWMYRHGQGVIQDYKAAIKWYKLAAEQGHVEAQQNLGSMYNLGRGVTQDYKAALKWYQRAASQGSFVAQYNLGNMYVQGNGVTQDNINAHRWWNIAASQGHEMAASFRKAVEKKMTTTQIEKAQLLALECMARNYKGC